MIRQAIMRELRHLQRNGGHVRNIRQLGALAGVPNAYHKLYRNMSVATADRFLEALDLIVVRRGDRQEPGEVRRSGEDAAAPWSMSNTKPPKRTRKRHKKIVEPEKP